MRSRGDEGESTRGVSPQEVKAQDVALDALRLDTQRNLRELAEATGGFLVANSNDLSTAVERVGADLRRYYEVAYAPPNPIADGQFRRIEVKLARRGATVRTRRGYFALPSGEASTLPYEAALAEALAQAPLPRDVAFAVTATPSAAAGAAPTVDVRVEVPLRGLQLDRTDDGYRGQFSVLLLVRDASGRVATKLSHDWPVSVASSDVAEAQARSATVRRALELAPGAYTIETVVEDRRSGRVGASRTPLVVGR